MRRSQQIHDDQRWEAVLQRDHRYDGRFYYAVTTTGIYCRPTCPSRRAKRDHVRFFATPSQAEHAGYRPCKRCKPSSSSTHACEATKQITTACRMMEEAGAPLPLKTLAAQAQLSPYHFHRLFKKTVGLTPRAYGERLRKARVRNALHANASVTNSFLDAGFNASSRFYEKANAMLGMTPKTFSRGGKGVSMTFATGKCSLGHILVAASKDGITAILLGDHETQLVNDLERQFPHAELSQGGRAFASTIRQVTAFIDDPRQRFTLPLDIQGTAFQERVWQALLKVPPGETVSYAELARRLGAPTAARAVARACASNTIAVAIPCHRVVRTDGALSGYRWGIERKKRLLEQEQD